MNKELYLNNVRAELKKLVLGFGVNDTGFEFIKNGNEYYSFNSKTVPMNKVISILVSQLDSTIDTNKTDRIDLSSGKIYSLKINSWESANQQLNKLDGKLCIGNMKNHFDQPQTSYHNHVNTAIYGKESAMSVEAITANGENNTLIKEIASQPTHAIWNARDEETAEEMIEKVIDQLFIKEIMNLASFIFHIVSRNQE